jgi:hypothetical protein
VSKKVLIAVAALVVGVAGFLLFRPDKLVVDDVVDQSLEDAFAAPDATDTPRSSTASSTTTPSTVDEPSTSPPAPDPPSTTGASSPASTSPPAGGDGVPEVHATGSFFGIDHRAAGTATIYLQDGDYVLRFEDDTDIQNGPDLYVWVMEGTDWAAPGAYLDLGTLQGNVGGQNYDLPPEFDPDVHRNVLIWCLRFAVPFAAAQLG